MTKLVYVDTSVAVAVAFREAGWSQLVARFGQLRGEGFEAVSSTLLRTEVRRVYFRASQTFAGADDAVTWINLVEFDTEVVRRAGELPVHVRTLDALHLASAQVLDDAETSLQLWALDRQMQRAAGQLGLELVATHSSKSAL